MYLINSQLKIIKNCCILLILLLFIHEKVLAITANDYFITDVTPVSFSVVWITNESATGNIEVYQDAQGADLVSEANISLQYTDTNNTLLQNQASANGILRARISGLSPSTPYFFRLTTTPVASGQPEIFPPAGPLLGLSTQETSDAISNDTFIVEIIQSDGSSAASGAIMLANVSGSPYPVSAMVGDGIDVSRAILNMANVYGNNRVNRELDGGESLTILALGGVLGRANASLPIPANNQSGELKNILPAGLQLEPIIDSDNDGIPDWYELDNGLSLSMNDAELDADGDSLSNLTEYLLGTDVNSRDTDQDGWDDDYEINITGTSPVFVDTDHDGINDADESASDTDPLNHDSDGDGFTDGFEIGASTNPNDNLDFPVSDIDNDTIADHIDNCVGLQNNDQLDTDSDGIGDICDNDIDGDGINNVDDNAPLHPNPQQEDLDSDGIGDLADNCPNQYNPQQLDSDFDGTGNACDADDDNDGVNDYQIAGMPSDNAFRLTHIVSFIGTTIDANSSQDAFISVSKFDRTMPKGQRLTRLGSLKLTNFEYIPEILTSLEQSKEGALFLQIDASSTPCNCIKTRDNDTITFMTNVGEITVHLPATGIYAYPGSLHISDDGSSYDAAFQSTDRLSTLVKSSQENITLDNCRLIPNTDQSDVDADGLGDVCDISEDDIDGDGILNINDNCPSVHNPLQINTDNDAEGNACDFDDDNDGLSDITESTIGSNPLLIDSDADGVADANEDFDFDGVSNIQEISQGSNPLISEGYYSSGLNYFHYPYGVTSEKTAFDLMVELGGNSAIQKIQRQNALTNQLETAEYIDNALTGADFTIRSGEGYLLTANQSLVKSFNQSIDCSNIQLYEGLNLIGFSCFPGDFSAFDALEHMGGEQSVSSIQRLNDSTGLFETATYYLGKPVGHNFSINNTHSYLIHAKQEKLVESPAIIPVVNITSHINGEVISTNEVMIIGDISDPSATVTVNGEEATIEDGIYTANLILEEGSHAVEVEVRTQSNLRVSQSINITVEIPPDITILSHTDGETVYQNNTIIFGEFDVPVSSVTVNGNPAIISGNTFRYGYYCSDTQSLHCDWPLHDRLDLVTGNNVITIVATGVNGVVSTRSININRERLQVATTNPGTTSTIFSVTIPSNIVQDIAGITIYPESRINTPFKGQFTPTSNSTQNGYVYSTEFNTEVIDALQGNYDYAITFSYHNANGDQIFSARALLQIDVPLSTEPPLITIERPLGNEIVNYISAQVTGDIGISAITESIVSNGVPAYRYNNYYAVGDVPLAIGSTSITSQAMGENDLQSIITRNLIVEPIVLTLVEGETVADTSVVTEILKERSVNINPTISAVQLENCPSFIRRTGNSSYPRLTIDETRLNTDYASLAHRFQLYTSGTVTPGTYNCELHWYYTPKIVMPLEVTVWETRDAPIISHITPTDGSTLPGNYLNISTYISNYTNSVVTINGVPATNNNGSNLYSAIVELSEGSNTITVEAIGFEGVTSTRTFTLNVVSEPPPVFTFTSHNDGDVFTHYRENFVGTSNTASVYYYVYINGEYIRSFRSGSSDPYYGQFDPIQDEPGNKLIEIYAQYYRNEPVATLNVTYDPPPLPEIIITSHTNNQVVTSVPITVTGSVSNDFGLVTVNGVEANVSNGQFSLQNVDLHQGLNTVIVEAGVVQPPFGTVSHEIMIDNQSELVITPLNMAVGSNTKLYHEFKTSQVLWNSLQGIDSFEFINGRPSGISTGSRNIIKLTGNRVLLSVDMSSRYDMSALNQYMPVSVGFSDGNGRVLLKEIIDLQLNVHEELKLEKNSWISVDGYEIQLTPEQDLDADYLDIISSGLPDGLMFDDISQQHDQNENTWVLRYSLSADTMVVPGFYTVDLMLNFKQYTTHNIVHTEERSITFEVIEPPVAPTITITSHSDNATVATGLITISGTVADENATVTVNGMPVLVTQNGTSSTFTTDINLDEGSNTINVQSEGATGLKSNHSININYEVGGAGGSSDTTVNILPGHSDAFSFDLFVTPAQFSQVTGIGLQMSGSSTAFNNIDFTFDSLTPVSLESKFIVGHTITTSASIPSGSYDLIFEYTLSDSSSSPIAIVSKNLTVVVP